MQRQEGHKRMNKAIMYGGGNIGQMCIRDRVGTVRTQDVITLARHAREVGCTAISMIPPYYYHFSLEEITGYYEAVARAVPDMPIILYNIPQFTGVEFTKENAARLMENPNIIGIKHTSHNLYALERLSMAYPDKCYLNCLDEMFLLSLIHISPLACPRRSWRRS